MPPLFGFGGCSGTAVGYPVRVRPGLWEAWPQSVIVHRLPTHMSYLRALNSSWVQYALAVRSHSSKTPGKIHTQCSV